MAQTAYFSIFLLIILACYHSDSSDETNKIETKRGKVVHYVHSADTAMYSCGVSTAAYFHPTANSVGVRLVDTSGTRITSDQMEEGFYEISYLEPDLDEIPICDALTCDCMGFIKVLSWEKIDTVIAQQFRL
jgi:hypothetical protein